MSALNNLQVVRARDRELALQQFRDEYLLRYLLEFETARSPSLLAVDRLHHPFTYQLKVQVGDEIVERTADFVETFNYLRGLHVNKLRAYAKREVEPQGRVRYWYFVPELAKHLRVVTLADGETVHNAFPDRGCREDRP